MLNMDNGEMLGAIQILNDIFWHVSNTVSPIQACLAISGRYVLLFWTANTQFADKKTHFD